MTTRNKATVIGLLMLCLTAHAASADETVSFQSVNYPDRWIRHYNYEGRIDPINPNDIVGLKDATFILRPALSGTPGAVSFESVNYPGFFLRHEDFRLKLHPTNTDHHPQSFPEDASFLPRAGLAGGDAVSYESVNFRNHFIRHSDYKLWVNRSIGEQTFPQDVSFRKLSPLWAGGGGGGLSADAQAILNAHNGYRAKHCVADLTWSPQMAAAAQDWANRCTPDPTDPTYFAHSGVGGENLYWGSGSLGSADSAVKWWYDEINNYNFDAPVYTTSPRVGHFTQLVWRGSQQLGCAVASCSGQNLWVCRYAPPGNFNVVPGGNLSAQQAQKNLIDNVPRPCR